MLSADIKPGNVLLSTGGAVKLCDFGVSTQLARSLASTYVGTAAYMAVCNAPIAIIVNLFNNKQNEMDIESILTL